MELKQNEQIKYDIGANLKRGIESVGGKLKISNERIYFKPHAINIQKKELNIPMDQIVEVEKAKSFGLIANVMNIKLRNGDVEKFVLGKRQKIIDYIESRIKHN